MRTFVSTNTLSVMERVSRRRLAAEPQAGVDLI
jgi:hypothetical protein